MYLCLLGVVLVLAIVRGADADNPYYSIWPNFHTDNAANTKITDDLNSRIDPSKIWISKSKYLGIMYWYAPLSDDDKAYYSSFPGVLYVAVPTSGGTTSHFRALNNASHHGKSLTKRELKSDKPALDQLKLVSQADGQKFGDLDGYYYDSTAGEATKIYIIDSGVETSHPEFSHINILWLHPGPFPDNQQTDIDTVLSHGTCMTSMAAGNRDGVAKMSVVTMVKVDTDTVATSDSSRERYIDALAMTYDDVKDNLPGGKGVVSMSWGVVKAQDQSYDDRVRDTFQYLIQSLIDMDVPCVVSAGNSDLLDPIYVSGWPALLAEEIVPDLIVVGAMNIKDSQQAEGTRKADFVKVYAPGEDVECAERDGKYVVDYGTSQATASTAGLVAYFMTLGKSGADARKQLYSLAYPRDKDKTGPPTIWNGVDTRSH